MARRRKTGPRELLDNLKGTDAAAMKANALAFWQRTSTLTYEEKNTKRPEARMLGKVGIIPFYQLPSAITGTSSSDLAPYHVPVNISKQAVLLGNLAAPQDARSIWERAGVQFDPTLIGGERMNGYYPAVVRLSATGRTTTGTEYIDLTKTSHITGRKYKLAKKRSGSIPMGRNLKSMQDPAGGGGEVLIAVITEADFGEVKKSIEDILSLANKDLQGQILSASYEPEVVRESMRTASATFDPTAIGTLASL